MRVAGVSTGSKSVKRITAPKDRHPVSFSIEETNDVYDSLFFIYDVKRQIILHCCETDSPGFQNRIVSKLKLLWEISESIDLRLNFIQQDVSGDGVAEREFNIIRSLGDILFRFRVMWIS